VASARLILQGSPAELYQRFQTGREAEDVVVAARGLIDHVLDGGLQNGMAIREWAPLSERNTFEQLKEELISYTSLIHVFSQRRTETWRSLFRQAMMPFTRSAGRWLDTISQVATQPCEQANALLRQRMNLSMQDMQILLPQEMPIHLQSDEVWLVGCYHLALGMYGSTYFPEIIATEWAYRWIALQTDRDTDEDSAAKQALYDHATDIYLAYDKALSGLSEEQGHQQADSIRLRMRHAARVAATLGLRVVNFCAEIATRREAVRPARQVAELVAQVAPMTGKHHQKVRIGGQILADRFADPSLDAAGLVSDLESSPLVRISKDGNCPFLNGLKFGGSMFGVFSDEQHALLTQWVEQIGVNGTGETTAEPAMYLPPRADAITFSPKGLAAPPQVPQDQRELFFQLVNIEHYPYLMPHAKSIVERGLERARKLQMDAQPGKYTFAHYFDFSAEALSQRVEDIYRNLLVEPYVALKSIPGREDVIFHQMTSMLGNLIDGAWLANIQAHDAGIGGVRARLHDIYADEMGRGDQAKNHIQLIYGVLNSMDITLPHVSSRAFIEQCELPDTVYPFAIHQLALSLFPRGRLPEIVGYNLAIEMFGLGECRMHEVQKLRHHGFDASYEEVHLSIDNMATGHARSSLELTIDYLQAIRSHVGEEACKSIWRRVWDGYAYFAQFVERPGRQSAARAAELVI